MLRIITSHLLLAILLTTTQVNAQDHGLKVPPGFKISLYADHTLANDIYCMTLDEKGNVVVSSRGWVKRLYDSNRDGRAEQADVLAPTNTGAMGLWVEGADLWVMADGWLTRKGQKIIPVRFGEHGGHAIRKGPDGCWYVIGGNDAGLASLKLDPSSPIKNPEAGGILRFSKDMKKVECIAHGFRNPYDFDFTPLGDIITYDSDTERDFLLPWYSPTRIYHVAHGHGWRLPGYMQSLARRDYYPDTVDILAPIGRGSPTGVVCYRHYQFPKRYWGGVFALDRTFGKIWFLPLEANGSSYRTKPEIFLESIGDNGFAPTDACVAPDGSLFVSIGGRGTRGAVYRIEYVGTKDEPPGKWVQPRKDIDRVLDAPQPLDAWSRAIWEPIERQEPTFYPSIIWDEKETIARRIRAIEVSTDIRGGIGLDAARKGARSLPWQVRARVAWSMGHHCAVGGEPILLDLAQDESVRVRVAALNALAQLRAWERLDKDGQTQMMRALKDCLGHSDKRVRLAAMSLTSLLDSKSWVKLQSEVANGRLLGRMAFAMADQLYSDYPAVFAGDNFRLALGGMNSDDPELRLAALRLLMLIDGDWCLQNPPRVVYAAYALQKPRKEVRDVEKQIRAQLRKMYPTGDANFDHEAARYFAMIEDDDPATVSKILARITKDSSARDDVHHLIVLGRLKGQRELEQTATIVEALMGLEKKWQGYQQKIKQNWAARLLEVVVDLAKKHPDLGAALLRHPSFVHPSHVLFTTVFNDEQRKEAAGRFRDAVTKDADFLWSPELVDLLALLPPEEHRPLFRKHWSDFNLRDAMLKHLVKNPDADDRQRLLDGLESSQRGMVVACLDALTKLPKGTAADAVAVLRRLRLEQRDGKDKDLIHKLTVFANRDLGTEFKDDDKVIEWFEMNHPTEAKLLRADEGDADHWQKQLTVAPWDKGDVGRGAKLFQQRSCAACHTGSSRIGADLIGIANRFSRDDLFTAILYPSRDVAPAFRVNDIETQDGKHFSGIVVFESADGVIVQLDAVNTVRIDSGNIASRQPGKKSLMPSGLLKDLKPEDLAALYAYLKSLKSGP